MSQDRKSHWDDVYETKQFRDVSWYQQLPVKSLELIDAAAAGEKAPIIDIGGGASTLVDHLVARGYRDVTVLDISESALQQARSRLAMSSHHIHWIVADVTAFRPERSYRVWHDRAVLHFLVDAADRQQYLGALRAALPPGGDLVLETFGPDGPMKCSGLEVRRYSLEMMDELLGPEFELQSDDIELHRTPSGGEQQFLCTRWRRRAQ